MLVTRWIPWVAVLVASCDFPSLPALSDAGGGSSSDGSPGGPCISFATLLPLDTCQLSFASDLVISSTFSDASYDTGTHIFKVGDLTGSTRVSVPVTHTSLMIGGNQVEVISARTVVFAASPFPHLFVSGTVPLVIASSTDIVLAAYTDIFVASQASASCLGGAMPGAANSGGGSGGGGGGFGANGGRGGDGNSDGTRSIGGAGGVAFTGLPPGLRDGCPGANGGNGVASGTGGVGGSGGGGLYLVAAGRIELDSGTSISVDGGGGAGGAGGSSGAGGGGSGGMILLEAQHILGPMARISANGGGGGGGADGASSGEDGRGDLSGSGASGGTSGGSGGSEPTPAGQDVTMVNTGGGGGGGGGAGIIRVQSADLQIGTISPDPR